MARRTPRRQREQRRAWIMLTGATAAILALTGLYYYLQSQRVRLDEETLCPTHRAPSAHYAVLMDVTDRYNLPQRTFIENFLTDLQGRIPVHAQVSIYAVDDAPQETLSPIASLCKPPTGEKASMLTQNPRFIRERWEEGFAEPLGQTFADLLAAPKSKASPIMRQIQAVALTAFMNADDRSRDLIIISDLLEHTADYSHYATSGVPRFAAFEKTKQYQRVRTDLRGVSVTILYARRDGPEAEAVQGRAHIDFWDEYIASMGGEVVRVKRIDG